MKIHLNGDEKELSQDSISVLDLLKVCTVEIPDMVSVQCNERFVERTNYGPTVVKNSGGVDSTFLRQNLSILCRNAGFTWVSLDCDGYRTGAMNETFFTTPQKRQEHRLK